MPEISRDKWDPETRELFAALTAFDPVDAGLAIGEGLVDATIPGAGGLVDQFRRMRDTRQAEFVVALAKGYRDLLADVSQLPRTPEFRLGVLRISEEAAEARNHAKRAEFMAAALNLGLKRHPKEDVDLFLATLGRLESIHLGLLAGLSVDHTDVPRQGRARPISEAIVKLTEGVDDAVRFRLYEELISMGLVNGPDHLVTEESDLLEDQPVGFLTGFGARFVEFIKDPRPQVAQTLGGT